MIKYFINKDFLNFPTGISKGEYNDKGYRIFGDHMLTPSKLSWKFPGFDSIEEILKYKYCKCGHDTCTFNKELERICKKMLDCSLK